MVSQGEIGNISAETLAKRGLAQISMLDGTPGLVYTSPEPKQVMKDEIARKVYSAFSEANRLALPSTFGMIDAVVKAFSDNTQIIQQGNITYAIPVTHVPQKVSIPDYAPDRRSCKEKLVAGVKYIREHWKEIAAALSPIAIMEIPKFVFAARVHAPADKMIAPQMTDTSSFELAEMTDGNMTDYASAEVPATVTETITPAADGLEARVDTVRGENIPILEEKKSCEGHESEYSMLGKYISACGHEYVLSGSSYGELSITNASGDKFELKDIYDTPEKINDLIVKGDYVFALEEHDDGEQYLTSTDISNPDNPQVEDSKKLDGKYWNSLVDLGNGEIYLLNGQKDVKNLVVNEDLETVQETTRNFFRELNPDNPYIYELIGSENRYKLNVLNKDLETIASSNEIKFPESSSTYFSISSAGKRVFLGILTDLPSGSENDLTLGFDIKGDTLKQVLEYKEAGLLFALNEDLLLMQKSFEGQPQKKMINLEDLTNPYETKEETSENIILFYDTSRCFGRDSDEIKEFKVNQPLEVKAGDIAITSLTPKPVHHTDLMEAVEQACGEIDSATIFEVNGKGINNAGFTDIGFYAIAEDGSKLPYTVTVYPNGTFTVDAKAEGLNLALAEIWAGGLSEAIESALNRHGKFYAGLSFTDQLGFRHEVNTGLKIPTRAEQMNDVTALLQQSKYGIIQPSVMVRSESARLATWHIRTTDGNAAFITSTGGHVSWLWENTFLSRKGRTVYTYADNIESIKVDEWKKGAVDVKFVDNGVELPPFHINTELGHETYFIEPAISPEQPNEGDGMNSIPYAEIAGAGIGTGTIGTALWAMKKRRKRIEKTLESLTGKPLEPAAPTVTYHPDLKSNFLEDSGELVPLEETPTGKISDKYLPEASGELIPLEELPEAEGVLVPVPEKVVKKIIIKNRS